MKVSKEKLEKIILGIVVGIIVIIVLITLIFGPNLRKIKERRAKIRVEKDKLVKAEEEVAMLAKVKNDIKKLDEQIKQYYAQIPEATPDWLLGKLNSLAGETGIDFDKIEPRGDIKKVGAYLLQGLYVELKTDYHTLGKFINKLENLSPFISILDLSITGKKDDINKHIVKLIVGTYVKTTD